MNEGNKNSNITRIKSDFKTISLVKERLYLLVLFILMLYFACFSYGMADYAAYVLGYERIGIGFTGGYQMEKGYILCEEIGNGLGWSFIEFRAVYLGIAIMLVTVSVYQYSKSKSFRILLLYIIYPFLFDIVQMRHFMASAITIFALRFLQKNKKGDIVRYIALVFVAATQHTAALVYLLLSVVYFDIGIRRYFKWIVAIILGEIFIITSISFGLFDGPYQLIISIISEIREDKFYLIGQINTSVFKHYILMVGIMGLLAFVVIREKKMQFLLSPEQYRRFIWMLKISLASLCLIPLIQISDHFLRVFRALLIIISLTLFNFSKTYRLRSVGRVLYSAVPWVLISLYAFMFLSPRSEHYFIDVTVPILKNNYFVEWLVK